MKRRPAAAAAAAACCSSSALYIRLRCGTSRSQQCARVFVCVCPQPAEILSQLPPKPLFFFNITRITVKSRITEGMALRGNVHVDSRDVALVWGYLRSKIFARVAFGPI